MFYSWAGFALDHNYYSCFVFFFSLVAYDPLHLREWSKMNNARRAKEDKEENNGISSSYSQAKLTVVMVASKLKAGIKSKT